MSRPIAGGKFFWADGQKLYVRGVTYGTFRPSADGSEYDPSTVERDFAQMAANGLNAVRAYTVPIPGRKDVSRNLRNRVR